MHKIPEIVYASDHGYLFLCCVSIISLMRQLPCEEQVRVHLLTDDSLSKEDERLLDYLSERFGNLCFMKHIVSEEAFDRLDFNGSLWSKAACYRLMLPELLSDVDICLYLDSDTLIVGDILPVFDTDMTEYYLAGVYEDISPVRAQTVGNRIPGIETYVNSGVLLMNLKLMRERDIQEKLIRGVAEYLIVDQDLLNVVCYGSIRLLPPDYNCIPGVHADSPKILHFLMRDYLRPWKNRRAGGSREWWRCAEAFRSVYDLETLRAGADWYQRGSISWILRKCADYTRVYVAGSGGDAERIHRALRMGKCKGLKGILSEEDTIAYAPDILLIVASRRATFPILESFLSRDGAERQVIHFSRWPVSYYNLVPENCRREVYGELLMWEFGVDAGNVSTCAALLELNAARYPDREALVEWKDGVRKACSFRELNVMANRMADWITGKSAGRGERVALPDSPIWDMDIFAAVLGILKSGCILGAYPPSEKPDNIVSLSALGDARYSSMAPAAEVLPEEMAVEKEYEGQGMIILTQRDLCDRAGNLRRRCGWHAQDKLLLASPSYEYGLIELMAAFANGNTTVITRYEGFESLMEIAERERCMIAGMRESIFVQTAKEAEAKMPGKRADSVVPVSLRMILAGDASEWEKAEPSPQMSGALAKWRHSIPNVPVNGQGYEGSFRYDCGWY